MKIKAFLFAALLLAGVSAFAQEASEGETGKGPTDSFISHSFKDNWFIGVGGGLNMTVDLPTPIIQGTGLALDLNFGKWLDPMWGIRAGFNGINTKDRNYADANGDPQKYTSAQLSSSPSTQVLQSSPSALVSSTRSVLPKGSTSTSILTSISCVSMHSTQLLLVERWFSLPSS